MFWLNIISEDKPFLDRPKKVLKHQQQNRSPLHTQPGEKMSCLSVSTPTSTQDCCCDLSATAQRSERCHAQLRNTSTYSMCTIFSENSIIKCHYTYIQYHTVLYIFCENIICTMCTYIFV
jgi:hypothetical protein